MGDFLGGVADDPDGDGQKSGLDGVALPVFRDDISRLAVFGVVESQKIGCS